MGDRVVPWATVETKRQHHEWLTGGRAPSMEAVIAKAIRAALERAAEVADEAAKDFIKDIDDWDPENRDWNSGEHYGAKKVARRIRSLLAPTEGKR